MVFLSYKAAVKNTSSKIPSYDTVTILLITRLQLLKILRRNFACLRSATVNPKFKFAFFKIHDADGCHFKICKKYFAVITDVLLYLINSNANKKPSYRRRAVI